MQCNIQSEQPSNKAHLGGTQLPKIHKALDFFLDSVCLRPTTVAPEIFANIRHLEQSYTDGPYQHMHSEQSVPDIARHAARRVGLFYAPEVGADGEDVEDDGDQ